MQYNLDGTCNKCKSLFYTISPGRSGTTTTPWMTTSPQTTSARVKTIASSTGSPSVILINVIQPKPRDLPDTWKWVFGGGVKNCAF